jgi:hypothetical protein
MFFILFQLSNKHDPEAAAVVFQKKSKKSRTQRWKVHKTNKKKLRVEEIGLNLLNGLWVLADKFSLSQLKCWAQPVPTD